MPYVSKEYYLRVFKGEIPESEIEKYIKIASRQIDTLTYNRIVGKDFENLTEFQKEIIQDVVCLQSDFLYGNNETLNTMVNGYSLNGVSISFEKPFFTTTQKGITMRKDVFGLLNQTGLCCAITR